MKVKKIAFILTFPRSNTWNGETTANDNIHCITRTVSLDTAERLLKEGTFDYNWDDGWGAQIECRCCKDARREIQKSSGFMGYEWMVDSLVELGLIETPEEVKKIRKEKELLARVKYEAKGTPCEGCKNIAFMGSGMYPCNSCSRIMKDRYKEENND